ncbi:hypothetical protein J6590_083704 [Homalodisca vitripennis]|nr:hypothetical protein J6590_083704 [Homalodisca vitripennis]
MVLLLLLYSASILLVIFYLQFRWRYRYILAAAKKLPSPPGWPLIGNALLLPGDIPCTTKNLFKNLIKFKRRFCFWVGPVPTFVISDPSDVRIILNSSTTLEKDDKMYKIMKILLGKGLITAKVSLWKKTRRLINPVFHPTNIENFLPVFNEVSREVVQHIGVEGEIFDSYDLSFNAALDAISRTVLSKRSVNKTIRESIHTGLQNHGELVYESIYKPWLHIKWIAMLVGDKISYTKQLYSEITEYFDKLWKEELCGEEYYQKQKLGYKDSHCKTLLDVSMDNPSVAGDDHYWRDERHTMLAAEKIYREILQEVKDPSDVTLSDLRSLRYLEQSLMESMRLYPSIPTIVRKVTRNTKLSTFTLPANSRVMIPFYSMGRDEDLFPDPEIFLPDRFSPDASEGRHPYAFLPFSGGPRNCIGKTYAMFFMKTVMVHLLRSYKVHSNVRLCDIEPTLKIVLSSNTKLLVRFENR